MPQFAFIAKDRMGNTVQGKVEAQNAAFAANQIGQLGYSLIELTPAASPSDPNRTLAMPGGVNPAIPYGSTPPPGQSAPPIPPRSGASGEPLASHPITPSPHHPITSAADLLQADAAKRRKVEADLARMGMKPDEIRRLLDANANTTEAAPAMPGSLPGAAPKPLDPAPRNPKLAAKQKLAARTADLHSFAAQLQSSSAAARVQAVEAVSLDLPEFRQSTTQERMQAETILREVYALRKREKYAEALAKCREALNLVPSDAAAIEMFGDLLQGVARTKEAIAAYKRAVEADPKRVSAERKYGDLLVMQEQWSERDPEEVPKNPVAAAVFSLLVPGAGQIHTGQTLKGVVLLVCAALSMATLVYLMRNGTPFETSAQLSARGPAATAHEKPDRVGPSKLLKESPVIACVLFYTVLSVGSAIDAASSARRARE